MTLKNAIFRNKLTKEVKDIEGWKEYKKECLAHWKRNEEDILSFLAERQKEDTDTVFITDTVFEYSPFTSIPKFYSDTAIGSFSEYLNALCIICVRFCTKPFATEYNDMKLNGFKIDLSSELPV